MGAIVNENEEEEEKKRNPHGKKCDDLTVLLFVRGMGVPTLASEQAISICWGTFIESHNLSSVWNISHPSTHFSCVLDFIYLESILRTFYM